MFEILHRTDVPALTALIIGFLVAINPCTLATNFAALALIGRDTADGRKAFLRGMLYLLGRSLTYILLGSVLALVLQQGNTILHIQDFLSDRGEPLLGLALILLGVLILLEQFRHRHHGDNSHCETCHPHLKPRGKRPAAVLGMGAVLALVFCPTTGMLYFGMLLPLAATTPNGWLLPWVFALAAALPVVFMAWLTAFSIRNLQLAMQRIALIQLWGGRILALLLIGLGIYFNLHFH